MGFAAIQTLVGVTQLSELGIDVSKNWLTHLIKNLGDPTQAQDAVTKTYVDLKVTLYKVTAGTYVGDDTEARGIDHSLGGVPILVLIVNKTSTSYWYIVVSDVMMNLGAAGLGANAVGSPDASSFYVGYTGIMPETANELGEEYTWLAFGLNF